MELLAIFLAANPIALTAFCFILVCIMARLCMGLMFQPRHQGDEINLTIRDFHNKPTEIILDNHEEMISK